MSEQIKRLNFNVPMDTYRAFKEIFPYPGELTAFFRRCMEAAIIADVNEDVYRDIAEHIELTKREVKDKRGGE